MNHRLRTVATFVCALLLAGGLAACGKSNKSSSTSSVKSTTTAGLKSEGAGSCKVKFSGGSTQGIDGKGGVSALGSDYWYSTDQLQNALDQINGAASSTTSGGDTAKKKVEAGEFVVTGLTLNCFETVGDHYSVNFTTSSHANRTNFPFKAAKYALSPSSSGDSLFTVLIAAGRGKIWKLTGGTIDITKFDNNGISGTFSIDATEDTFGQGTPGTLHGEGTFDMPCAAGDKCASK
jgi:hypothetical protein